MTQRGHMTETGIQGETASGLLRAAGVVLAMSASLAACEPAAPDMWSDSQGIVGGNVTDGYPAVVAVSFPQNDYTGTVITPRVVLTVAHGVDETVGTSAVAEGLVTIGTSVDAPDRVVGTTDARMHRYYNVDTGKYYDIALVLLAEDAGVEPMDVYFGALDEVLISGDPVRVVGYGRTSQAIDDYGTKRESLITLSELTARTLGYYTPGPLPCNGDSGSPHLIELDGIETLIGISKSSNCADSSTATRVAPYWDEFVVPTIDRWEGACKLDGVCTTDGCRTPDPDCDPCGFNDQCGEDCPQRDLDCPLLKLFKEPCANNDECESGLCVPGATYPERSYCTLPCSERLAGSVCDADMECVLVDGFVDEPVCRYPLEPQPDGAECTDHFQCASEVCHQDLGTCVAQCVSDDDCGGELVCGEYETWKVCGPPEDPGCGCRTANGRGGAPLVLLALVGLLRRRRLM